MCLPSLRPFFRKWHAKFASNDNPQPSGLTLLVAKSSTWTDANSNYSWSWHKIGWWYVNTHPTTSCQDSTKHSEYVKSSLTGYHLYISILFAPSYLSTIQWLALTPHSTSRIKRRMRLLATATSKPCTGRLGCQAPFGEEHILKRHRKNMKQHIYFEYILEIVEVYYISLFEMNLSRMVRRKKIP